MKVINWFKQISVDNHIRLILTICISYLLLHVLLLFQIIPYTHFWGGKVNSIEQIYVLELVAILILLLLGVLVILKKRTIEKEQSSMVIKRGLQIFMIFFILNTIGNLLAETTIEKLQAFITAYMAFALYKLTK